MRKGQKRAETLNERVYCPSIDMSKGAQALQNTRVFIVLVWSSDGIVTMNRIEERDITPLNAIRFRPMQELKMDDFPGGCSNPLNYHGTLSCTSLNKSYFYPGLRSHYLHAFTPLPKLLEVGMTS